MTYTTAELNQTGIYAIINLDTGKRYIGSTAESFKRRWSRHKQQLRNNKHHSPHLQASWNKHTEFRFEFKILEFVKPEHCLIREQWWIDLFGVCDSELGYNICPTAGSPLGRKTSEETKLKMSLANQGKTLSEEHKLKISLTSKGKKLSEEHKLKLSLTNKGKQYSLGISHSEERKLKMSSTMRPQGYFFIHIETKEGCIFQNLTEFCRNRNLSTGAMSEVANGKRKSYKGWVNYTSN